MAPFVSTPPEETLVRQHERLVDYMVNRFLRRFPAGPIDREDLMSWGRLGLLKAARAWTPERGVAFSTLACKIIERSLIRGMQSEGPPAEAPATVSLDAPTEHGEGSCLGELLPAAEASDPEIRMIVRQAIERLAEGDRALIVRRYYEGWSLKEVGEASGLSSMRVLSRERQILRRLRVELAGALDRAEDARR